MKILHTGDWHIGSFKGPEQDGRNLRGEDTKRCIEHLVKTAEKERPDFVLVSGDIFDKAEVWQSRSHSEVLFAKHAIEDLANVSRYVIVMRGTPNHDSKEAFEELEEHFKNTGNVEIVTTPKVLEYDDASIAVLPGFDRGKFRADHPGLSKDEEHERLTEELGEAVEGLKAMCTPGKKNILMAHYTVLGANTESGQIMMFAQFEPIITPNDLIAAHFDLVALAHIHRPQQLEGIDNCFYCGAVNQMTFNDEGQERGFYIHEEIPFGWKSRYIETPYRHFYTVRLSNEDIEAINREESGTQIAFADADIKDSIVRVLYSCTAENRKALNTAMLEKELYDRGAFYVKDILPERVDGEVDRKEFDNATDPETNLIEYLRDKGFDDDSIGELVVKARPIIEKAQANISVLAGCGVFEPVEIEVKNYRNYVEEKFNFENISFCTINGANGAGKSSLFMDAIVDCLYEEPREGELTGWIRNAEDVKAGSIMFTFKIGEKTWRVTRTRTRSGKVTINLAELVDGAWENRSAEKARDTQEKIVETIGMDSMTFKSCALIMQDQYGLFMEAPAKDRMAVLAKILGLEIYDHMHDMATDEAKLHKANVAELKAKTQTQTAAIDALGDPETEMKEKQPELEKLEADHAEMSKERDRLSAAILTLQEAQERALRIKTDISMYEAKKADLEEQAQSQADIIRACNDFLETEVVIEENAGRYREYESRKKELIEAVSLYKKDCEGLAKAADHVRELEAEIAGLGTRIDREKGIIEKLEYTEKDAEILAKAEEYKEAKQSYDEMLSLLQQYSEADGKVKAAERQVRGIEDEIKRLDSVMDSTRSIYEKDIMLLQSDCGCIDISKATCKFLEKAKTSKEALETEEKRYQAKRTELAERLSEYNTAVTDAVKERDGIGYDSNKLSLLRGTCTSLEFYRDQAERIKQKAGELETAKASLAIYNEQMEELKKKLALAQAEIEQLTGEVESHKAAFEEDKTVTEKMEQYAHWIEEEAKLPVIKERFGNAVERQKELNVRVAEYEKDIIIKNADFAKELAKASGYEEKKAEADELTTKMRVLKQDITEIQMAIGALKQKQEQINRLKAEIADIRQQENDEAALQAAYETLRTAFSQEGIPHQIVRSIIPKFTDTANNILGQMTGGKMGVGFKLERVQTNKKEVVTLDAIIEEYGKSALPYLSRSGGEKVKASLSVILALAEIKSQAAGVQLGMLFIDEPPFLDGDGIQAYCDALDTIQRRYSGIKIMAITHDPTMKARFSQNLDVIKTDHGSKVLYQ